MAGGFDKIDAEVAAGRSWRAKEMLAGRLRGARYEPELFRRYADVLAGMRDDDAAGRFYLLAGVSDGTGGGLARAFLARRARVPLPALWATMPAAARRLSPGDVSAGTIALLVGAGHGAGAVAAHFGALARDAVRRPAPRRPAARRLPQTRAARAFAWVVFALLCVIAALGLLRLVDLLVAFARHVL